MAQRSALADRKNWMDLASIFFDDYRISFFMARFVDE